MDKSKQVSLVYDKIVESYVKEFSRPSDYIDNFLDLLPKNAKILDVGCGFGFDANFMTSRNFDVIGLDLSKEMSITAKQKFPKIDFRQQDIRELDFSLNSFDGIFASFSLIHLPKKDIPSLLKKFHQILKQNGILYISLQGGESEETFIDEPFKPDEKLFLNIMSFDEIKNLLTKNNFSIIEKYERKSKSNEVNFFKLYVISKAIN